MHYAAGELHDYAALCFMKYSCIRDITNTLLRHSLTERDVTKALRKLLDDPQYMSQASRYVEQTSIVYCLVSCLYIFM